MLRTFSKTSIRNKSDSSLPYIGKDPCTRELEIFPMDIIKKTSLPYFIGNIDESMSDVSVS